jgi:hypothetical protein
MSKFFPDPSKGMPKQIRFLTNIDRESESYANPIVAHERLTRIA